MRPADVLITKRLKEAKRRFRESSFKRICPASEADSRAFDSYIARTGKTPSEIMQKFGMVIVPGSQGQDPNEFLIEPRENASLKDLAFETGAKFQAEDEEGLSKSQEHYVGTLG
jgi:hypothetical protein